LDITSSHDELLETPDEMLKLAFDEISKITHTMISEIPEHFLLLRPDIMLHMLSDLTLNNLVSISYDWQKYSRFIIENAIYSQKPSDILNRLELLKATFGIDYHSYKLDNYSMFSTWNGIDKLFILVDTGLQFEFAINLNLNSVMTLPDEKIDRLVEIGFDFKTQIEKMYQYDFGGLRHLISKYFDKFIKYYPNYDHLASLLIPENIKGVLKTLLLDYGVDIMSALEIKNDLDSSSDSDSSLDFGYDSA
jgi:hypothetical protein